jgi:ATP-binding cassette subfamily B protein
MFIASFAEVFSIGAVLPFLAVLTAPERVFGYQSAQPFIHAMGFTEPKQLLLPLVFAFVAAALFSGAMRLILLWAQTRFGHGIGADFSTSIYRRTLYQPYAVHVARNSSEVIAGISLKANALVSGTVAPILSILSSSLILFAILFALLVVEPLFTLAAFAGFGAIYALIMFVAKKKLERDSQCISREQNQVYKALQEGLSGIRDVLIDGTQEVYCKIYNNADLPLRRAISDVQLIGVGPRYAVEAFGMAFLALLAYLLVGRSEGAVTAIPVLGAMALGAQRLLPIMQQIYASISTIRAGRAPLAHTLDLIDQPLPAYAGQELPTPIRFQHSITLSKLAFQYAAEAPWVLRGVDLTLPKGARIGFIGTTGSGKSTLLDIVMGLLSPTEGSLAIDGESITSLNHRSWQVHLAHVPQAIFLADISIAENIAFGVPPGEIDHERVRLAAQKAQVAQVIESWDQQYNTLVGERGVRLSGGQRQRIGIARALYKRADVLVFDEATSALDNETERAVMEAIESLGDELTILIVAHRLTTLKNCTQIVELSDGCVKRIGTYSEIVGQPA